MHVAATRGLFGVMRQFFLFLPRHFLSVGVFFCLTKRDFPDVGRGVLPVLCSKRRINFRTTHDSAPATSKGKCPKPRISETWVCLLAGHASCSASLRCSLHVPGLGDQVTGALPGQQLSAWHLGAPWLAGKYHVRLAALWPWRRAKACTR